MYQAILFDLDGTITASGEGITKSVQYALEKLGIHQPDLKALEVFVGPPLMEQFQKYANLDEEQGRLAVEYYRERYSTIGIFENYPYEGMEELLGELKKHGYRVAVASSKPEQFVLQVLDHYHLTEYFDVIVGAEMNGQRTNKAEVVEEALHRLGMENDRDKVIMVGDKEHDVYGARACGIECLSVAYGYGTMEELIAAHPLKIVHSVQEVGDFFA